MKSLNVALRRAIATVSAIAGVAYAPVTVAQPPDWAIVHSDTGKQATRLADEVYVKAQDLSLLQEFYAPRDIDREKRAQGDITMAMNRLERLEKDSRLKAQKGKLPSAIARFVDKESAAARAVISTQASLRYYHDEEEKYPLGNGPHLRLLKFLFGKLPGNPGTPEFYLQLLTWARKGFPPLDTQLNTVDPALTPQEVYLRKLQQLVKPGGSEMFNQNPGLAVDKGDLILKEKALLNNKMDQSKAGVVKGGK